MSATIKGIQSVKAMTLISRARTQISMVNDEWECLCGNEAADYGFHPSTREGAPLPDADESPFYRCDACELVIERATGLVVVIEESELRGRMLVEAINARSEWHATWEFPGAVHISGPRQSGPIWCWGYEGTAILGNDQTAQNSAQVPAAPYDAHAMVVNAQRDAGLVVREMRRQVIRRVEYLQDVGERMCAMLERQLGANGVTEQEARAVVNEWRQR